MGGVFCFDKKFLSRPDFSSIRFQFFLETLRALREELRESGGDLLVLDTGPLDAFGELFAFLKKAGHPLPSAVSWNRDYEPFATARDAKMKGFFEEKEIRVSTERDHVLIEPSEIQKPANPRDPYKVYTPFSRKWLEVFQTPEIQRRVNEAQGRKALTFTFAWKKVAGPLVEKALLEAYLESNAREVTVPLPPAGSKAAMERVKAFKTKIDQYATARDIPTESGTSGFSIFFKNGSLTVAQVIALLDLNQKKLKQGPEKFLKELIWREFYVYILSHFPAVEKLAFLKRYENLDWENNKTHFEAWKQGLTGYPLVDAGMRQLNETGWMHNRVRMVVASFLCKDLLIDWRWGERYFMERLLDGDLAPNNGGWQWAASTGCDPQPYFRIFNPELQSRKFDPEGSYIRKYVPELGNLDNRSIHAPAPEQRGQYPQPIVDHSVQRAKALKMYKEAMGKN